MSQFEEVSVEDTNGGLRTVERLEVPGGWVYVVSTAIYDHLSTTSCFVPAPEPKLDVERALATLTKAFQEDPDFARTWHDNIAVCFRDAGGDRNAANAGAAKFMKLAFVTDTSR